MNQDRGPESQGQDSMPKGTNLRCKSPKEQLLQISAPVAPVYWKSVEELRNGRRAANEFPGGIPAVEFTTSKNLDPTRRDFLTLPGVSMPATSLSRGRAPRHDPT